MGETWGVLWRRPLGMFKDFADWWLCFSTASNSVFLLAGSDRSLEQCSCVHQSLFFLVTIKIHFGS